jgi:predicted NACHT family NTPase
LPRRRLVIGGPGTGKTTLAVQLLVHLLATRQEREPVPVGLLRVIGPAYQFRHAELQDHLAPPAAR